MFEIGKYVVSVVLTGLIIVASMMAIESMVRGMSHKRDAEMRHLLDEGVVANQ
jgi:hypothetical protein